MEGHIYEASGKNYGITKIEHEVTLKYLQDIVGGYIPIIYLNDGDVMIINEEGKIDELPRNNMATKIYQKFLGHDGDFIVGTVLVTKSKYIT